MKSVSIELFGTIAGGSQVSEGSLVGEMTNDIVMEVLTWNRLKNVRRICEHCDGRCCDEGGLNIIRRCVGRKSCMLKQSWSSYNNDSSPTITSV
jgi:hypothetical protein